MLAHMQLFRNDIAEELIVQQLEFTTLNEYSHSERRTDLFLNDLQP